MKLVVHRTLFFAGRTGKTPVLNIFCIFFLSVSIWLQQYFGIPLTNPLALPKLEKWSSEKEEASRLASGIHSDHSVGPDIRSQKRKRALDSGMSQFRLML
ncbi:hypothetical protein [Thermoactinomyces mirandus]|uniref:hypothetical protein n=1 Tax=Thermoactinomyces mirandus TaxID=2756294 RepID=UPI0015EEC5B1|nr:hypothetical protein [Thermoactinomyces mirandus]